MSAAAEVIHSYLHGSLSNQSTFAPFRELEVKVELLWTTELHPSELFNTFLKFNFS